MKKQENHFADEALLAALDGELPARRLALLHQHLAECPDCRMRMLRIESTAADLNRAYRTNSNCAPASLVDSRARLRSNLAAASGSASGHLPEHSAAPFGIRVWAAALALLLVAAVALRWAYRAPRGRELQLSADGSAGPQLPDARLTPGSTRTANANDVCSAVSFEELKPPLAVQRAVFHEYRMDGAPVERYEVDHLITPALGGTDDIRNLWPESYSSEWNAHVKDELEDRLHDLVCQGKLDLPTAQRDMAKDWIAAYKKYFQTDKPLPHESALSTSQVSRPNS